MQHAIAQEGPLAALTEFVKKNRTFPDQSTMVALAIVHRVWSEIESVDKIPIDNDDSAEVPNRAIVLILVALFVSLLHSGLDARSMQGIYAEEDAMANLAALQSLLPDYTMPLPGDRKNPFVGRRLERISWPENFPILD